MKAVAMEATSLAAMVARENVADCLYVADYVHVELFARIVCDDTMAALLP